MASGYRNSAGVDTDALFDPDIVGDGPSAAAFRMSNGVGLKYAAAKYGTPGPVIGMRNSAGVDNGPMWAAKGTAVYALSINGTKYSAGVTTVSGSKQASLTFNISTSGWLVYQTLAGVQTVLASGSLPAGAYSVKFTDTWLNASGDTGPGSQNNMAPSATVITGSGLTVNDSIAATGGQGTKQSTHAIGIVIYNSAGSPISNTSITFEVAASGE